MTNKPWLNWLITFVALLVVGIGVSFLLRASDMPTAGQWSVWIFGIAAHAWCYYGVWKWRDRRAVQAIGIIIITGDIAGILSALAAATGNVPLALAVSGMWGLTVFFVAGLALIRLILLAGLPIFGVARTLIDEAIRMKVALIFIIVLLIMLPLLPLLVSQNDRLEYRITNLITFSMILTSFILSILTIGVCVLSINNEIRNRQVFLTLTKPIGRWQYLMGKWLGMTLLNLLLVAVAGSGTYLFVQVMVATGDFMDAEDKRIVETEVLTARRIMVPTPPDDAVNKAVADTIALMRERMAEEGQFYDEEMIRRDAEDIRREILQNYFTINPQYSATYKFENLGYLRDDPAAHIAIRMRPRLVPPPPDDKINFFLIANGVPYRWPTPTLANDTYYTARIPSNVINEQGELNVLIGNRDLRNPDLPRPGDLMFKIPNGFELLHRVDSFEMNLTRSMLVIWFRLWFIAALAITAGTFLSLPIACIFAGMFYLAAASSGFVAEALEYYAGFGYPVTSTTWEKVTWVLNFMVEKIQTGDIYGLFKIFLQLIGEAFILVVPQLSNFNPTPLVSDGRYVPWMMVGDAFLWVGIFWTGITALVGWLIFRKRELARVVV